MSFISPSQSILKPRASKDLSLTGALQPAYKAQVLKFPEPDIVNALRTKSYVDSPPPQYYTQYFYREKYTLSNGREQKKEIYLPKIKNQDLILFLKKIRNSLFTQLIGESTYDYFNFDEPVSGNTITINNLGRPDGAMNRNSGADRYFGQYRDGLWANVLLGPYLYNVPIEKQPRDEYDLVEIWQPPPNSEAKVNVEPFSDRFETRVSVEELVCDKTSVELRNFRKNTRQQKTERRIEYLYPSDKEIVFYLREKRDGQRDKKSLLHILYHNLLKPYIY
jgi:hypothetical protein